MMPQPTVKYVTLIFASLAMLSIFFNQALYNTINLLFLFFVIGLFIRYKATFQVIIQPYRGFFILLISYFLLYQAINLYHLNLADYWYAFRQSRWLLYAAFLVPLGMFLFRDGLSTQQRRFGGYFYLVCALLAGLIVYDSFTRLVFHEASTALWFKTSSLHTTGPRVSWTYNPIPFSQLAFFAALLFYAVFYGSKHRGLRYASLGLCLGMLTIVAFSQTRGSWLALLVMSGILFFFFKKTSLFIVTVFFAIILSAENLTEYKLLQRLLSIQNTTSDASNTVRLDFWQANLKLSADHPWLGVGYAANLKPEVINPYLRPLTENESVAYKHPHNEYLDRLSGMGGPALILFISILCWPLRLAWQLLQRPPPGLPVLWLNIRQKWSPTRPQQNTLTVQQYHVAALALGYLVFLIVAACFDQLTLTSCSTLIFCWALIFYLHDQLRQSDAMVQPSG
jgi:O-antigen ligase